MHVSISLANGESRVMGRCNVDFFFFCQCSHRAVDEPVKDEGVQHEGRYSHIARAKIGGSEFGKHIPQVLTSLNSVRGFL